MYVNPFPVTQLTLHAFAYFASNALRKRGAKRTCRACFRSHSELRIDSRKRTINIK